MSQNWNFDPAGTALLEPSGPRPTPQRLRKVLRRERETLESLRPQTRGAEATPLADNTRGADATPLAEGRDAHGRFTKCNKGGTGNPFARQIAGFRTGLVNAATDADFAEIARVLIEKSKGGDLAAIKLFLSYTLGKPTEAPDPDRLDLDDFQLLRARLATLEDDWHLIRTMVPVEGITEAGHRVADLRAECWREDVLGPAAETKPGRRGADSAVQARAAVELEEELAVAGAAAASPPPARAEAAAAIEELLRALRGETEKSLAILTGQGVPPSANGGTAAGAPSANGDPVAQAPARNGADGGHAPSAIGDKKKRGRSSFSDIEDGT